MFSYCALHRERLAAVDLPDPLLGIVLAGRKEVWRGQVVDVLLPGTLFVLPRGVPFDILNLPGDRFGSYQSLVLEIRPCDLPDLAPPENAPASGDRLAVPLSDDLVDAVVRAAAAIADGPARGALRASRLTELLALLYDVPEARALYERTFADRAARLVRADLAHEWTAADVARRLAVSESTLRRRLAAGRTSFSALLRRERMQAAQRRLAAGEGSQAAALAVGYVSRAHFARAYREEFGVNPSGAAPSRIAPVEVSRDPPGPRAGGPQREVSVRRCRT